uniref:Uncharacterized protein n=1 Tax=Arundo donax TaxID=35708 RepID=A0A0A9FDH7_ARUDO
MWFLALSLFNFLIFSFYVLVA